MGSFAAYHTVFTAATGAPELSQAERDAVNTVIAAAEPRKHTDKALTTALLCSRSVSVFNPTSNLHLPYVIATVHKNGDVELVEHKRFRWCSKEDAFKPVESQRVWHLVHVSDLAPVKRVTEKALLVVSMPQTFTELDVLLLTMSDDTIKADTIRAAVGRLDNLTLKTVMLRCGRQTTPDSSFPARANLDHIHDIELNDIKPHEGAVPVERPSRWPKEWIASVFGRSAGLVSWKKDRFRFKVDPVVVLSVDHATGKATVVKFLDLLVKERPRTFGSTICALSTKRSSSSLRIVSRTRDRLRI